MISKHSHEQSDHGEGVHVVKNEPCEDEKYGKGQFTEKRVYLSRYCILDIGFCKQVFTLVQHYSGYSLGIGDRRILRLLHRILQPNIACFQTELCPSIITLLLLSSILLFLEFLMKPLIT